MPDKAKTRYEAMKSYPIIIFISTVLSMAHFFFRSYSTETEYLVWDISQNMAGLSILAAFTMYISTKYWQIGIKLITAIFLVLSIIETGLWLIVGQHQWWPSALILASTFILTILKARKWSLLNIHQGEVTDNPCIVFTRPRNFLGWIGSLFGWGVGSSYIVVGGYRYAMSSKTLRVWKSKFTHLHNDEFIFEITTLTPAGIDYFKKECDMLVDSELNIISNNCLTCFTPVLRKFGERPKTILPGVYLKTFLKRK